MLTLNSTGKTLNLYWMRTKLTIFILALLAFAGCVPTNLEEMEGIVLNLVVEDSQTRETRPGDDALNENVVSNRIDIFFYNESTGQITKEALQSLRVGTLVQIQTNPNDIEDIFGTLGSGAHCGVFVVANFAGTYEGTPGSRTISQIKSSLLEPPVWDAKNPETAIWESTQSRFVMTGEMQLTLGNAQGSTPVYATVPLSRVAAKVTFSVTVASNVATQGGNTWVADTSNMSVYMVYAMRKATLGADPITVPATANDTYSVGETIVLDQYKDRVLYSSGDSLPRPRKGVQGQDTTVKLPVFSTKRNGQECPFYTYPVTWEVGSSMEPYMKLIIPWTYGNTTRKYYYKIPFHDNTLLRNHWYHISIDVQILGTEQADPPEVSITYAIGNWSGSMDSTAAGDATSPTSVPATIITAKYLNVPTTEYELFNEDRLVIPILSSHDVEIVGFTVSSDAFQASHQIDANFVGTAPRIYNPFTTTTGASVIATRPNYSETTISAVNHSFTPDAAADSDGWSLRISGRDSIIFSHPLNRDLSSTTYDVAPYSIRFRVRHEGDETGYFTDITIEQKPSIIIRPYANSGGTSNYGYVYVNGGHANGSNNNNADGSYTSDTQRSTSGYGSWTYYLGTAGTNLQNSGNTNPNMFVVETSVLPTTGDIANYVLGDPRSREIDNLGQNWSQSKAAVTGGNRRLTYYYPAGDEAYDNFIAPKLRFASSFGATMKVTFVDAQRRCASYQEDGFPAGRWRLPTVAEITYIATLNADGKIVRLLGNTNTNNGNTTDYWCNSGYMTVYNGTGNNIHKPVRGGNYSSTDTKSIRCVYDEWYWEGTTYETLTNKGTFTWGDQQRSDVRRK